MSKEKQIEEMWNIITTDCDNECVGCEFENDNWCFTRRVITDLYNAGYRKQSEGEWSFDGMSWTCSECGEYAPVDKYGQTRHTDFCPECGAKMKGGAE